jgi:hypothetical protein
VAAVMAHGRALALMAAALVTVVAATVFKTVEVDNAVAWMFLGAALILVGAWASIEIYGAMREINERKEDDRGP